VPRTLDCPTVNLNLHKSAPCDQNAHRLRQTDGRTDEHHGNAATICSMNASCANNMIISSMLLVCFVWCNTAHILTLCTPHWRAQTCSVCKMGLSLEHWSDSELIRSGCYWQLGGNQTLMVKVPRHNHRFISATLSITLCACLTLSVPHFFWLWQKWVYQSIQGHTGLTQPFNFLTFGHSGAQSWAPEFPSVKKLKRVG